MSNAAKKVRLKFVIEPAGAGSERSRQECPRLEKASSHPGSAGSTAGAVCIAFIIDALSAKHRLAYASRTSAADLVLDHRSRPVSALAGEEMGVVLIGTGAVNLSIRCPKRFGLSGVEPSVASDYMIYFCRAGQRPKK